MTTNLPTTEPVQTLVPEIVDGGEKPTQLSNLTTVQTPFKPTPAMKIWVAASVSLATASVSSIAMECGVDRKNWYVWLKKPGFLEWYDAERERNKVLLRAHLDAIGLNMAKKDHAYWRDMQKIAGRDLSEDQVGVNPPAPVQVNFNSNKYVKDR